eukprot:2991377-Rhodomonas_salina.1
MNVMVSPSSFDILSPDSDCSGLTRAVLLPALLLPPPLPPPRGRRHLWRWSASFFANSASVHDADATVYSGSAVVYGGNATVHGDTMLLFMEAALEAVHAKLIR